MDNTWVKLYRKLGENNVMRDATALQVLIWCMLKVDKKTGSFTTGRFLGSEQLGLNSNTFYKALKRLDEKYKIVTLTSNNKFTSISLLNWAKYNSYNASVTQSGNNKVTTKEQQSNTKQDIKNKDIKTITNVIKKPSEFGNTEITDLVSYMQSTLGLPMLDDTIKSNRQYANLALKKYGGFEKVKLLIDATAHNPFWSTKITSFKSLYYRGVQIVSSNRGEVKSLDAEKILHSEIRQGGSALDGGGISAIEASITKGN